jgi:hypothetical protein
LDSIRFDFFGRMLVLKDEVQFLKQSLIDGLIDGSQYEGNVAALLVLLQNQNKLNTIKSKE